MEQQIAYKARAAKLPLPRDEPCCNRHNGSYGGEYQVVVRGGIKARALLRTADKIEQQTGNEQTNRQMNDNGMLGVLREDDGSNIEWANLAAVGRRWGLRRRRRLTCRMAVWVAGKRVRIYFVQVAEAIAIRIGCID